MAVVHFGERNKPGRFIKKRMRRMLLLTNKRLIYNDLLLFNCSKMNYSSLVGQALPKWPNINFNAAFVPFIMMRIRTLSWRSSDGHPSANKTNICSNFCFGVCHVVSRLSRLFWRRLLFSGSKNLF